MRDNESSAEYLARLKAEVAAEHRRREELAEARKAAGLPPERGRGRYGRGFRQRRLEGH